MISMASALRCGSNAAPASGSSRPRKRGPASTIVTLEPSLANAWASSTPTAPPPSTTSRSGSSRGMAAWRLVQKSTLFRPSIGGIAAVPPLAITTARLAVSWSPPTSTVRRSTSFPSPRTSLAPVASSAAAGRESSRSRAIHSTRLETFGKSTSQSTREAASVRARPASSSVSPDRSSVFDGTQPQYGHSPPTSSRSTTAIDSPLPCSSPAMASPATPPPRQTTSNSCGNRFTSRGGMGWRAKDHSSGGYHRPDLVGSHDGLDVDQGIAVQNDQVGRPVQGKSVLDGVDTGLDGHAHRAQAFRVGRDPQAQPVRLVDQGVHLLACQLRRLGVLAIDGARTAGHHFYVIRPAAQLFPDAAAHLPGAVRLFVHRVEDPAARRRRRDDPAAGEDPGSFGQAEADRLPQHDRVVVVAADVADRCDARPEECPGGVGEG